MRERKRTRLSLRAGALTVACVAVVMSMFVITLAPTPMEAGPGPLIVRGYVWDSLGNPVVGADVTVNIKFTSTGVVRSTLTDTTNSTAQYQVSFGLSDWDVGDTIEAIASYDVHQNTNTTVATSAPIQRVNVTLAFVIPEFGSLSSLALTGSIAMIVGVVLIARRRR